MNELQQLNARALKLLYKEEQIRSEGVWVCHKEAKTVSFLIQSRKSLFLVDKFHTVDKGTCSYMKKSI